MREVERVERRNGILVARTRLSGLSRVSGGSLTASPSFDAWPIATLEPRRTLLERAENDVVWSSHASEILAPSFPFDKNRELQMRGETTNVPLQRRSAPTSTRQQRECRSGEDSGAWLAARPATPICTILHPAPGPIHPRTSMRSV